MTPHGYIYLCYHKVEAAFAIRIATDLQNMGVKVWMDRLDIEPGDDWFISVQTAIQNCSAFLPIMSPDYVTSSYGLYELDYAEKSGRRIFPVLLRPVNAADWPPQIGYRQFVDFDNWQDEETYRQRINELVQILRESEVVEIYPSADLERHYLRDMSAMIEIHKTFLEYVRLSYQSQAADTENDLIRPRPRINDTWGIRGSFALLNDSFQRVDRLENIYDSLNQYPRILLLGSAGSGKTTTILRLIEDAVRFKIQNVKDAPLPFFLDLTLWDDNLSFKEFILAQWRFKSDPFLLMKTGRVVAYLDNLGSMGVHAQEKAKQIHAWLHSTDAMPSQVVVACELVNYNDMVNIDLPIVGIERLDRATSHKLISLQLGEEDSSRLLKRIFNEGGGSEPNLQWAIRNPLLLRALIYIYSHSPFGDLPNSVGNLLLRLVMLQWERERILQNSDWVPFEEIRIGLAKLAFTMINDDLSSSMDVDLVTAIIGEMRTIYALASANILRIHGDKVSFLHPVFQRVFAALQVERDNLHATLARPEFDEHGRRIPRKWDSVIEVLSGFAEQPSEYIRAIADVDPYLAVNCILSGHHIDAPTRQYAVRKLLHFAGAEESQGRLSATTLIEKLTGGETITILLDVMRMDEWHLRVATAEIFRDITTPMTRSVLDIFQDWDWSMDSSIAIALRRITDKAVPILLKVLDNNEDAAKRRGAAWALGELGDKAAVPMLVFALGDMDSMVRKEVVIALKNLADVKALPRLLDALQDEDWAVRKATVEALQQFGSTAVPWLLKRLRDENADMRRISAEILGRIGDSIAVTMLVQFVADPDVNFRAAIVVALGRIRDPKAVPALSLALDDSDVPQTGEQSISQLARQALLAIGTEDAINEVNQHEFAGQMTGVGAQNVKESNKGSADKLKKRLIEGKQKPDDQQMTVVQLNKKLQSKEWKIRRDAVERLGDFPTDNGALTLVLKSLKDEDQQVRFVAVNTLRKFNNSLSIRGLMEALYDGEEVVSGAAADALSEKGTSAINGLVNALDDSNPYIRGLAVETLGKIKNPTTIHALSTVLADMAIPPMQDHPIAYHAAQALKAIGTAEALAALNDTPYAVEVEAEAEVVSVNIPLEVVAAQVVSAEEQAELVTDANIDILVDLLDRLHSEDWKVRQRTAKELHKFAENLMTSVYDRSVLSRLINALDDDDPFIRFTAVEALAWLGDNDAVPAIVRMLSDESYTNRIAAIRALGEIGEKSVVLAVAHMMDDDKLLVREVAAEILGKLKGKEAIPALLQGMASDEGFMRRTSIESLGEIGIDDAVPHLLPYLDQDNPQIRWAVVEALGKIADPRAIPDLANLLGDPYQLPLHQDQEDKKAEQDLSDVVALALESIGTPEALKILRDWRNSQPAENGV